MSKFRDFLRQYDASLNQLAKKSHVPQLIICGYSDFFLLKSAIDFARAAKSRYVVLRHESIADFQKKLQEPAQSVLFGEDTFHLVTLKTWTQAAGAQVQLAQSRGLPFAIIVEKSTSKSQLKGLPRETGKIDVLEATDPWPGEYSLLLNWLAKQYELTLPATLAQRLFQQLGAEPWRLDNALRHLKLFGEEISRWQPDHLGKKAPSWLPPELSEQSNFWMSDVLAEGNLPGAHQHLQNMVRRGESPLGVLALVQKSLEGALKSQASWGLAGFSLDKKPAYPMLQKKYQALSTHSSRENLLHAYRQCQRADFALKSKNAHALLNLQETLPRPVGRNSTSRKDLPR